MIVALLVLLILACGVFILLKSKHVVLRAGLPLLIILSGAIFVAYILSVGDQAPEDAITIIEGPSKAANRETALVTPEATLDGYIESLRQGNVKGVLDRYDGIKEFHLPRPIPIDKYQIVKKIIYGKKEVTTWNDKGIRPSAAIGDVELQVKEWINGKEQLFSYNFRSFNGSWKVISHSAWGVD